MQGPPWRASEGTCGVKGWDLTKGLGLYQLAYSRYSDGALSTPLLDVGG